MNDATDAYSFSTRDNAYFNGRDMRITRDSDGRTILVNRKHGYWAVNVKSEYVMDQRSLAVRTAASNLPDGLLSGLEERSVDLFWREAGDLARNAGFSNGCYQEGRGGGWMAVADTEFIESPSPADPLDHEREEVERWIFVCFKADELRELAEDNFDENILTANQELQIELSQYADWLGAVIQGLDGGLGEVTKLEVINGRAALRTGAGWYSMAPEAELIRKADGGILSRLTADPIMEQVFQVIEARDVLTKEQIDAFLDADDDHDPAWLYDDEVARAVNAIEDQIAAWVAGQKDAR